MSVAFFLWCFARGLQNSKVFYVEEAIVLQVKVVYTCFEKKVLIDCIR